VSQVTEEEVDVMKIIQEISKRNRRSNRYRKPRIEMTFPEYISKAGEYISKPVEYIAEEREEYISR